MQKTILYQLDGKLPNLALMRLSSHFKLLGHEIELRGVPRKKKGIYQWEPVDAPVYASLIFEKTRPLAESLRQHCPQVTLGGTGWDLTTSLESLGIQTREKDYQLYPEYRQSLGFTQRGCRLRCPFCCVPKKEGAVRFEQTIEGIWRGWPWPREVVLLDNDFFGQEAWRERIAELRDGSFKVSFNQGINVRFLNDETAAAIASVNYRDDQMKTKRIYTAWDNTKDEKRVFAGLDLLVKHGVKPDHIMVYLLIGYWPEETVEDWLYRRQRLRKFGCRPYPMPYVRTREAVGFQRWCVAAYDKRVTWEQWVEADYEPRKLRLYQSGAIQRPKKGESR